MSQTKNNQSGFAIGTILLAVVLIAAIVSAIAIASRGTQSQSGREQARVNATTIMQQGINLKQGFDRMVATSLSDQSATSRQTISLTRTAGRVNTTASLACDNTNVVAGTICLYSNPDGGAAPQQPPAAGFTTIDSNRYKLMHNVTLANLGSGSGHTIAYASSVTYDACRQINSVANNVGASTNPPRVIAANFDIAAAETAGVTIDEASGPDMNASGAAWNEGCFYIGAADPAANAWASATPYVYFRVLYTN